LAFPAGSGNGVASGGGSASGASDTRPVLLAMRGMHKTFGATRAVDGVDIDVHPGEVLALLGQNGAGKSTLIKILAGVYRHDSGEMLLGGRPFDPLAQAGAISFIHQDLGLIDWMTVAENMALAQGFARRRGLIDWEDAQRRARQSLQLIAGDIDPLDRIQDLSRTEKSLVAIARALSSNARIIVLDEPTASLPQEEVEVLFGVLRRLREQGIALIYVSHRIDEIFAISDRIVVLRDGRVVHACRTADANPSEIIQTIIGKPTEELSFRTASPATRPALLRLSDVVIETVGPLSFEVRPGEVVGLVGLRGAGQELVGRALIGAVRIASGEVTLKGRRPDLRSPADAVASGIGFVPSDRIAESLAPTLSVRENIFLNPGAAGRGLLSWRGHDNEAQEAVRLGAQVHLRPNDPSLPIENLSGGNQQKVVIARWLRIGGDLLVLEEPTSGVDVGARLEIYRLLDEVLAAGKAVLVISTDLEEIERICHRALVFRSGRIVSCLEGETLTMKGLVQGTSLGADDQPVPVTIRGASTCSP
jgi:ribose transport system ATP-binding protein